jgi:putative flippase GtrA
MGAGVVSTVVDVLALLTGVRLLHLAAVPAAALGVAVGSVVSFVLNKYVAFRDGAAPMLPQVLKYVATVLAAMAVHATLIWLLVDHWTVPILVAKLLADFLVFTVGGLWMMRFVVFRLKAKPAAS